MSTKVKFVASKYGNYQDHYYTDAYGLLISKLEENVLFEAVGLNLGITDGVVLMNTYRGDFTKVNCAIVEHDTHGKHVYKIIKKEFIRKDMWRITMVKDMVSASHQSLENSTILVNRLGIDRKTFTPLLYNQENMTLSQVKTGQIDIPQLYSENGYCKPYGFLLFWAKDSLQGHGSGHEGHIGWEFKSASQMAYDYGFADIRQVPLLNTNIRNLMQNTRPSNSSKVTLYMHYNVPGATQATYEKYTYWTYDKTLINEPGMGEDSARVTPKPSTSEIKEGIKRIINDKLNDISLAPTSDYTKYNGKVLYDMMENKYYKATLVSVNGSYNSSNQESLPYEIAFPNDIITYARPGYPHISIDKAEIDYDIKYSGRKYVLEEIENNPTQNFTLGIYRNVIDQPYQLTYVPVVENAYVSDNGDNSTLFNKEHTLIMLYDLIRKYGGANGKLLDVQLTPYAPIVGYDRTWSSAEDELYVDGVDIRTPKPMDVFKIENASGDVVSMIPMYEVLYSDYEQLLEIGQFDEIIENVTDYKLWQQNRYVFTSPSGGTQHDISASKNLGLDYVKLKMSVRPYGSIFQLQPIYKGLYGDNFNDTRGLIWKEESSLTFVTSAWETYKRQNVNFLNSFNADQDYKRSVTALNHEANKGNFAFDSGKRMLEASINSVQLGLEGGALMGPAVGGVLAAANMGASVVGEAIEYGQMMYNHKMENKMVENDISYAKTQFNYAMGNIQALPENLEKVSGINIYNNMVPYIQIFEPTEIEKVMYTGYLDSNGVAVNQVIDIKEYDFNYIQGSVLIYDGVITNEEYVELQSQLKHGVRKFEV